MALTPYEKHKAHIERKRAAGGTKLCECGCGEIIKAINSLGKPARFKLGHNRPGKATRFKPGQVAHNKGKPAPWARVPKTPEQRAALSEMMKRDMARRRAEGWKPPRQPPRTPEQRARQSEAMRKRDMTGTRNPFYGKKHTPEARAKMGGPAGPTNPGWKGGVGTLPYGPEFTKKFKRMIRERDKHTCQKCGKTREENGRTLDVHHIDNDKFNNDPTNLAAVCQSCHRWMTWHPEFILVPLNRQHD